MTAGNRQNRLLIPGSLFTAGGLCLWKAADLLQTFLMKGNLISHTVVFSMLSFVMVFCAFGQACGVRASCQYYIKRNDYRGLQKYRMLSSYAAMAVGFLAAVVLVLCSSKIGSLIAGDDPAAVRQAASALCWSSPVLVLVPLVFVSRAYYEELGYSSINAFSQYLEYGVRILLVFLLSVFASGSAVASAAAVWLPVIASLALCFYTDQHYEKKISSMGKGSQSEPLSVLMQRAVKTELPYLCSGLLLSLPFAAGPFFMKMMYSMAGSMTSGMFAAECVLTAGVCGICYAAGLCSGRKHLAKAAEYYEQKNARQLVRMTQKYLVSALAAVIPVSAAIAGLSAEICTVLGIAAEGAAAAGNLAVQGGLDAVLILMFVLLCAIHRRKDANIYLAIGIVFRYAGMYLLMKFKGVSLFHAGGWIGAAAGTYLLAVCYTNRFELEPRYLLLRLLMIVFASFCMNGVYVIARHYMVSIVSTAAGLLLTAALGLLAAFFVCVQLNVLQIPELKWIRRD